MENSSLDIPLLVVFWKGSKLDRRIMKVTLPDEGKFHNISANYIVELKLHFFFKVSETLIQHAIPFTLSSN